MMVPAGHAEVLPQESPDIGEAAASDQAATFAGDVSGDCVSYSAYLASASAQLSAVKGAAVVKHRAKLEAILQDGARTVKESADTAKRGFIAYSSAVERIHRRARSSREAVDSHLNVIRAESSVIEGIAEQLRCRVAMAWNAPPAPTMPTPALDPALAAGMDALEQEAARNAVVGAHEHEWRRAVSSWLAARDGVTDECVTWTRLLEERKQAEQALLRTLRGTELGHLISAGSGPGAPGPKHTIARTVSGELWGSGTGLPGSDTIEELIDEKLTPEETARLWAELERSGVDTDALIEAYCFELADRNGLPFRVMDLAGRAALDYALSRDHPEQLREAAMRMGFAPGARSLAELRADLEAVRDALSEAERMISVGEVVQLVALGQHDGAATAGISMGDLDRAATVGLFVPGMMSNVRGLSDAFDAFALIRDGRNDIAMVTWAGYRAPGLIGETVQTRGDAGGVEFAAFLDGIAAQRADNPSDRLVVLGHSYGTNVVSESLKITRSHVDAFVTLGSAGLTVGTTRDSLRVGELYATHARGDNIAQTIGQHLHFRFARTDGGGAYEPRIDPQTLEGVRVFSSEKSAEGEATTMHNLKQPIDWKSIPFDGWKLQLAADVLDGTAAADEIGYLDKRTTTVRELSKIMRDEWKEAAR